MALVNPADLRSCRMHSGRSLLLDGVSAKALAVKCHLGLDLVGVGEKEETTSFRVQVVEIGEEVATRQRRRVVVHSDQTLYRYIVGRRLGGGGYGEVFRAKAYELDCNVAIKQFHGVGKNTGQLMDDWSKEYNLHEALSHPNILQVLDAFELNRDFFIVTELATCSMDKFIDEGTHWDDDSILLAGVQLCSALHYIHEFWNPNQSVVHRDLTPKNVFYFEDDARFKIGDFGISKVLDTPDSIATTQIANWGFVAPELISQGFTSQQSDLYQLGLVLLCMATGEYPVNQHLTNRQKARQIASGLPWKKAAQLDSIDEDLQRIIKKLLLRNLSKRYPSAQEAYTDMIELQDAWVGL